MEIPYNPTYRSIFPIHKKEKFQGILIINYFAKKILEDFVEDSFFDITILDKDGFIMYSKNKKQNWEKYNHKVPINRFYKKYADIKNNEHLITKDFVSHRLNLPLKEPIYVLFELKKTNLKKDFETKIHEYLIVSFVVLIIAFIFSIIIGKIFNSLIHRLEEISEKEKKANRSKSEFLANMSHEIRTPLNGIIGLTNLIADTKLNSFQADYVSKIKKSSNALLGVINDILDYSKIEANKLLIDEHTFELNDLWAPLKTPA